MSIAWQPSASIDTLRSKARILAKVRAFFAERGVLEVDTPLLCGHTVSDPHLQAFSTHYVGPGASTGKPLYLQTSPEYAMKRLLCAGSGPIYQIAKAFRNEESGRQHNPEFTMLEWYRPGFDHHQLMDEVEALVVTILDCQAAQRISYCQAFESVLGVNPLEADITGLRALACERGFAHIAEGETDQDTLLQLLFCCCVEAEIGQQRPCLVYDFPASQAALARLNDDGKTAARFELYFRGLELANGFYELADADEQAGRFAKDNAKRRELGLTEVSSDPYLLAALSHGLPDCAGVALGLDRLMMLALDKGEICEILTFDLARA